MDNEKRSTEVYPVVRRVTVRDRKELSKLVKLFTERSGNANLVNMIPGLKSKEETKGTDETEGGDDNDQVYELIKSVMESLLNWVDNELTEFFMDLTGVTHREDWGEMPFDIELYVIDELIKQKGFKGFFSRASGLYKLISS